MSQSVSFIMPVRDRQYDLQDRVCRILEILAELTPSFEMVVVDYGSHDDTRDIASELAREFPQVRWMERPEGSDLLEAAEAGIRATTGDIIFIHDMSVPFSPTAIRQLWQIRDDDELVMAQSRASESPHDGRALRVTPRAALAPQGAVQMLRRCALAGLQPQGAKATNRWAVDRVTRTDLLQPSPTSDGLPRLLTRLRQLAGRH